MHRPIGVTILAILGVAQAEYLVYLTLVYLGILSFEVFGGSAKFTEPAWGSAILSGTTAAIYAAVAVGFWRMSTGAWWFGVLLTGWNTIWLLMGVAGRATIDAVALPLLLNLATFAYLFSAGVRAQFIPVTLPGGVSANSGATAPRSAGATSRMSAATEVEPSPESAKAATAG